MNIQDYSLRVAFWYSQPLHNILGDKCYAGTHMDLSIPAYYTKDHTSTWVPANARHMLRSTYIICCRTYTMRKTNRRNNSYVHWRFGIRHWPIWIPMEHNLRLIQNISRNKARFMHASGIPMNTTFNYQSHIFISRQVA